MKQRQYRRCHSIPMFIGTPCTKDKWLKTD